MSEAHEFDGPQRTLHLVRHGQSTWNAVGRWQGQADPPLSDTGEAQAASLAAALATAGDVGHVWSSDLVRAHSTAVVVAAACGVALEVDADLREIDVGDWSGSTRAEIGERDPAGLAAYFAGDVGWNGGESYAELDMRTDRVIARLATLLASDPSDVSTVVVVSHGGTIRSLLLGLLELDRANRWRLTGTGHGAASTLVAAPHGWRLTGYNRMLD